MPVKRTLNIPDRLVDQYDAMKDKSAFFTMSLDAWPVLEKIAARELKHVFDVSELTILINIFQNTSAFIPNIANRELLTIMLQNSSDDTENIIDIIHNNLGNFEIFFLVKFLVDANTIKNNKIATVDKLK